MPDKTHQAWERTQLEGSEVNSNCNNQQHASADDQNAEQRGKPLGPLLVGNTGTGQNCDHGADGGPHEVGEAVAELGSQASNLTVQASHVGQRNHDGHGQSSLTGVGRNKEVDDGLNDEQLHSNYSISTKGIQVVNSFQKFTLIFYNPRRIGNYPDIRT